MSFISLVNVEFMKIKRSKILFILLAATIILWIPSILNVRLNIGMQAEGILRKTTFLYKALWLCHGLCFRQVW